MPRSFLVVHHPTREETVTAAAFVCRRLLDAGVTPLLPEDQAIGLRARHPELTGIEVFREPTDDLELVVTLGGDGTILGAAELRGDSPAPLLGTNMGHVGFLAEAEVADLGTTVERALARDYEVEERLMLDVSVWDDDDLVARTWALNEAAIEKADRARMIEVLLAVDGQPISSFGADGVILSTPTGSTAYSFSAGGPIVWPTVDAMLMVPLGAHALFTRPLVVAPGSTMTVTLTPDAVGSGVLWCDGRRRVDLEPGMRVEAARRTTPMRFARLQPAPFSDRLVAKFNLPVRGWRSPA